MGHAQGLGQTRHQEEAEITGLPPFLMWSHLASLLIYVIFIDSQVTRHLLPLEARG